MYNISLLGILCLPICGLTQKIPEQAQVVNQKAFNVLETVSPNTVENATTVFVPPGLTAMQASAKPFHVYNDAFYDIIGDNPTLTLIARTDKDPLFHEAVVWNEPTDEVFFVQNAGAADAGTGLNKSAIIQKISLAQVANLTNLRNASGQVDVVTVPSNPQVINPNGATKYRGQIVFTGEGQGADIAPSLFVMNPKKPYNTTGTFPLSMFFGVPLLTHSSSPQQLFRSAIQLSQRRSYQPTQLRRLLHRHPLWVLAEFPARTWPPQRRLPPEPYHGRRYRRSRPVQR
jgi:hypothetical protein